MTDLKLNSRNRYKVTSCPCGKSNKDGKFVPYENYTDKGFCHSCNQTFLPNQNAPIALPQPKIEQIESHRPTHFPKEIVKNWLNFYQAQNNNFLLGLTLFFGLNSIQIAKKYNIGLFDLMLKEPEKTYNPLNRYNGCTIFFYKDAAGYFQGGKIMRYNPYNLKRDKNEKPTWLHSIYAQMFSRYPESNTTNNAIAAANYKNNPCFFGEHLLKSAKSNKIAIVESEKTAIIANESGYFPDILFLAAGGSSGYAAKKFKPLKNRQILILPDNDILTDTEKRANLENVIKDLQAQEYSISIWADLPNLYSGVNSQKADLADVLLNERATLLWSELVEHRAELEANGFNLLL